MKTESPGKPTPTDRIAALGETAQIEAATAFDANVVVTAGPGTGKTRVLTERYIYALETGLADVHQIVAFTLTDKAAAEMTSRIRSACLEMAARRSLHEEKRRFWAERAARLDTARISTLHAAAAAMCRRHAEALGIDPEFTVLDELESAPLLGEFLDDWLGAVQQTPLAPSIEALVDEYGLGRFRSVLDGFIGQRSRLAYHTLTPLTESEYASRLMAIVQKEMARPDMREAAGVVTSVEPNDPDDKLAIPWRVAATAIRHFAKGTLTLPELGALPQQIVLRGGRAGCWGGTDAVKELKASLKLIRDTLQPVAPLVSDDGELARWLSHSRELLGAMAAVRDSLWADLRQWKLRRGVFDFEDLLVECERLLRTFADVRRAERRRIRYLMVDELQDSSRIDAAIIRHLGMPGNDPAEADLPRNRLFIVGDDKQSIYRFRGADVSVFREIAEGLGAERHAVPLSRNFRSSRPLIGLFNRVFERLMPDIAEAEPFENRYAGLVDNPKRPARKGFKDVAGELLIVADAGGGDDDTPLNEAQRRRLEAAAVAQEIGRLIGQKGVAPSDIAILFRTMGHVAHYTRALEAAGLSYYVHAGRGFYERQEVRDLTVALQYIERPHDALHLVGALRGGLFGVSDRALFWLAHEGNAVARFNAGRWPEAIGAAERDTLNRARALLGRLVAARDRLTLPETIDSLVHDTGYDVALAAGFDGRQALANVAMFAQQAAGAERMGIDEFVEAFRRNIEQAARQSPAALEAEAGAIRLMTIHAAKGLEFSVVALPGCNDARRGRQGQHEAVLRHPETPWAAMAHRSDPVDLCDPPDTQLAREVERRMEQAELKRLLFVAMTRAEDYLLVSGAAKLDKDGSPKISDKSFMAMLLEGLGIDAPASGERHEIALPMGGTFTARCNPADAASAAARARRSLGRVFDAPKAAAPDAPAAAPLLAQIAPPPSASPAPERIGVTALLDYDYCPALYALRYRFGLGSDPLQSKPQIDIAPLVGTAFHRLVALDGGTDDAAIDAAVSNVLWSEGIVDAVLTKKMRGDVAAMLDRWRASALAQRAAKASAVRSEIAFTLPVGQTLVEGQIDKLLVEPDGYAIVDFKSGRGGGSSDDRYRRQLGIYAAAIDRCLPDARRREVVLYSAGDGGEERFEPSPADETAAWIAGIIEGIARGEFGQGKHCCDTCRHEAICRRVVAAAEMG